MLCCGVFLPTRSSSTCSAHHIQYIYVCIYTKQLCTKEESETERGINDVNFLNDLHTKPTLCLFTMISKRSIAHGNSFTLSRQHLLTTTMYLHILLNNLSNDIFTLSSCFKDHCG